VLLIRRGIYTYKKHPERGKRFTRNDARHALKKPAEAGFSILIVSFAVDSRHNLFDMLTRRALARAARA
jgi:hypothetical protein